MSKSIFCINFEKSPCLSWKKSMLCWKLFPLNLSEGGITWIIIYTPALKLCKLYSRQHHVLYLLYMYIVYVFQISTETYITILYIFLCSAYFQHFVVYKTVKMKVHVSIYLWSTPILTIFYTHILNSWFRAV